MKQTLRPYQQDACHAVFDAIDNGYKRILYTQPTGTGKTTTFAELCRLFLEFFDYKVLVLAHRRELITQAWKRISEHCGLDDWEIGAEIADSYAPMGSRVIVGSVQTVKNKGRLANWHPDVIITDEAHHAAAKTYLSTYERFGVPDSCIHIGCTATAKRTDKQSLYAIKPDGSRVSLLDKKTKRVYDADPSQCVYDIHCYEFSVLEAIDEGWLVPIKGHAVETQTSLNDVETDKDGDFKEGQLQKAVDNAERTILAINAWKEIAETRQTIVFCAGVDHAHHSAELWQQAGYKAAAVDGTTDPTKRYHTLEAFRNGDLQILCNMGLYTEGADIPNCGSVVLLRPTKSWNLYVQMVGRGCRVLPGVVDGIEEGCARVAAILASSKPDCMVIDLVDICEKQDICTVPSILDLPATLDLEGQSVTQAKKLLDQFEEVRDLVIGETPTTFTQLEVRLRQVSLMNTQRCQKYAQGWKVTDGGFRFSNIEPGYQATLLAQGQGQYELLVTHRGQELLKKRGKPMADEDFAGYLKHGTRLAQWAVGEHKQTFSRGTLNRLTEKQQRVLLRRNHTRQEIDAMPYAKAKGLIDKYMREYKASLEAQASEVF